ncbi:alpha/beta hydrolase family protein [Roseateles sp. BYS87W]|uniref:Alpha/beta hydrolase family protein n=1 Tax=Pelomonas baiyunensis TaxID=3299026 RepID=A0ABW7GZJ2_9BURK
MIRTLLATALALALTAPAHAADLPQTYQQPSAEVRAVLDAPGLPQYSRSPDERLLARMDLRRYRSVAELARPILRLAGKRIDAAASGPQLIPQIDRLSLRPLATPGASEREVKLPAGGGFHQLRWSPDGRRFLLNRRTAHATELWVGDSATGQIKPVPGVKLNTILEADVAWLGADELVVLTVPDGRGPAPVFDAPDGPVVQESMGRVSPERTLQDLLKNSQDDALFTHVATSALRRVNLKTGTSRQFGTPGLYANLHVVGGATPLLLTERLVAPYSYQLPWNDFARQVELLDAQGQRVRDLGAVKRKDGVPIEGVITGPRSFWASPLADGAVYWVEALDGGDQRTKVPHRDRLMRLDAPYRGEAREVHRTAGRLAGLTFMDGGPRALVTEFDRDRLWVSVDLLALDGSTPPARLQDRSMRDRYRDLGTPLTHMLPNGRSVVRVDDEHLLLAGAGASPEGDRPFIDRLNLRDRRSTRLFQSGLSAYERPITLLADGRLLTSRETATEPPNLMLRSGAGFEQAVALTAQADPTPQLRGVQRELIKFKRADGVELSFWRYLPPDYKAGERRPTLVWAYPLEFTDASTAGQVSGSSSRFTTFAGTSPLMLLLDGYVVLMDATMPVVGDPKTVNDSFVEQITANAKAIIDKAVELGTSDRDAMVVGGHSYGAFMTANLLAHTDLFKAGIARSGAYNRTLTPFGFQSERRSFWEAQDVYLKLSPFNYADKLKEPLLLIHGESDDNPGTFPIQSARFYQALAGTGGNVRYVVLPHESHGYSARESIGHTLWEMSGWMKRQTRAPRPDAPR